jgi:hypothetical protein
VVEAAVEKLADEGKDITGDDLLRDLKREERNGQVA